MLPASSPALKIPPASRSEPLLATGSFFTSSLAWGSFYLYLQLTSTLPLRVGYTLHPWDTAAARPALGQREGLGAEAELSPLSFLSQDPALSPPLPPWMPAAAPPRPPHHVSRGSAVGLSRTAGAMRGSTW